MWDIKKHLTFIIFISLFSYSINGYSQENIGDFENSYQYQYINNEIKKTEDTTLSQLQNLLTSTDITKKQQYFIHHNLAYLHFKLHNKNKTLSQLNTAIDLIEGTDLDTYHLAKSLLLRGKSYGIMFRDIKTAIADLKQAIQASNLSTHAKITNLRFDLQTAMAQAYNQLGQLDKAQEYSEQSLKTATLLNDKNETIYALIIAGRIAFQQNNFDLAYQNYLKALKLSDSSTPKNQIASIELRLAIAYESQSNFEQALIHAQKATTLYSQLSSERLQIKSLRVLGNIYLSLGQDIDTALVHFINGLSIAKSINSVNSIGQMQHLIGRAYLLENNINKAKKYLNSAQTVLKKSKSWFYLGLNTIELAKLTEQQGNSRQAIILLNKLLVEQSIQNYPSLLNEAKTHLINLYINQEDYKNAYLLQQQIFANKQIINKDDAKKMIKKFDHDVEIKSLNEHLTQAKHNNEISQQQLKKSSSINNLLMLFILSLALLCLVIYLQKRKLYKRFIQRCNNSFLTWSFFKKNITTESAIKNGLGLLICKTDVFAKLDLSSQYRQSLQINKSISAIKQLNISSTCSINHDVLWLLCEQPVTRVQNLLLKAEKQSTTLSENTPLNYIWINLDDFPHNISAQCIIFIEKLVNHLFEISTSIDEKNITTVRIQSQALPIIFSSNENSLILDRIKKALQQGFITTERLT